MEARSEAAILGIMMLQEASLTFGIHLAWPQSILEFFPWVSSIFNFSIAFSGPECFGEGGYSARWATNAMAPVVLIVLHGIVFCIRLAQGKEGVASQAVGSLVLWCKIIFMMMMQLAFETWVCSTPVGAPEGTNATLDADPFVQFPAIVTGTPLGDFWIVWISGAALLLCAAGCARVTDGRSLDCTPFGTIVFLIGAIGVAVTGGDWDGLFIGGLFIFLIFGIGFVGGSAVAIIKRDR